MPGPSSQTCEARSWNMQLVSWVLVADMSCQNEQTTNFIGISEDFQDNRPTGAPRWPQATGRRLGHVVCSDRSPCIPEHGRADRGCGGPAGARCGDWHAAAAGDAGLVGAEHGSA